MIILLILFVAIFMYNLKIQPINQYNEVVFEKKTSSSLYGLSTLLVLLHHIGLVLGNSSNNTLYLFYKVYDINIGELAVGIFFFISGFGLLLNHKRNPSYIKTILTKKLPLIYVVYVITNAIYVVYYLLIGKDFSTLEIVTNILGIVWLNNFSIINSYAWFIPTIMVLYLAFFIIYYVGNKVKLTNELCSIFMVLFVVVYYISNEFLPYDSIFRRSIFCFVIGLVYALYYNQLNKFFKKHYLWCLFVILTIFCINQFFFTLIDKSQTQIACLVCLIVLLLQKVDFGNIVLSTIKRVGIEIYLLQFLFINLFKDIVPLFELSKNWYAIVVFFASIISAVILHLIIKYSKKGIVKIIKYIKSKKEEPLIG